jgi:diaminopimelate decarboxylase
MAGFTEKNGILHADDVPLDRIAKEAGTPTYVYAASVIRDQFEKLQGTMAKVLPKDRQPLLCYACKANSHIAVLSLLNKLGGGVEIVSEGELVRSLRAGVAPEKIVSTGVGKQKSEIAACLNAGIAQINVESLPELEFIEKVAGEIGKTAQVVFRFNPNVSGGGHDKISTGRKHDKFGVDENQVFEGFAMAKTMKNVQANGISMHIGSQVFNVDAFKTAFQKLPALVKDLRGQGYIVTRLDIGGGFPIQYRDEKLLDLTAYAEWVRDIIVPLETTIVMEPGRYLVGNAGVLLTEVLYMKEASDRHFAILDAGMNDLVRPAMYDAYHGIEPVANRKATQKVYDFVGPVCESSDKFAIDRASPELRQGDLVAIRSAGAYGASMASNYNTRLLPAEVLVNGDTFTVIRKRQSYDDILKSEIVPDWLK